RRATERRQQSKIPGAWYAVGLHPGVRRSPRVDFGGTELERDLGRFLLFRLLDYEKFSRGEIECAGDEVGWKNFAARVVGHHRIVVSLTRERDFVLGRSQFFHQTYHCRVRLEIRVRLRQRKQPTYATG